MSSSFRNWPGSSAATAGRGELLGRFQRESSALIQDQLDCYHFWPIFRRFLLWELEQNRDEGERKALYDRGGLYYELSEQYGKALECYAKSGDYGKVSQLLARNADLHPGMGHYEELEPYYSALPEKEIRDTPALMQAMSMLCAIRMDFEGSEHWYQALQDFARSRRRTDGAGREARSRLVWLDLALPQREVEGMIDLFPKAFRLLTDREVRLPPFSVTSTMPSLMNGGKDFSPWSKRDDLLYTVLRVPVEGVLGRTQADAGRADDARQTLVTLRERFEAAGEARFLPNLDAMLCRVDLRRGDDDEVSQWYREKAPKNPQEFYGMKRYQYLTQAMAELKLGEESRALLTLAPLKAYFAACRRYIDSIHLHVLLAIARARLGEGDWQRELGAALDTAAEFQFLRPVSQYGSAVLPLVERCGWRGDDGFRKRLIAALRVQAAHYPDYLSPRREIAAPLSAAELKVLRLLCADKSNAEIGEILGIRLPTVKVHVSHILEKLGVKRRTEAKTAAQRLHLN